MVVRDLCVGHYPLLPRAMLGPILQARPPPEGVPNQVTDRGIEPESSFLLAFQLITTPSRGAGL